MGDNVRVVWLKNRHLGAFGPFLKGEQYTNAKYEATVTKIAVSALRYYTSVVCYHLGAGSIIATLPIIASLSFHHKIHIKMPILKL